MTAADRKETKEMIVDVLAPLIKQIEGRDILMNATLNNIGGHMGKIDVHLEKLNGKVIGHEKIIDKNLPHTIADCSQVEIIQEIRDNMISRKAVYGAVLAGIGALSAIVGIVFAIVRIVENIKFNV